jgi:hypothetical protein
LTLKIQRHKTCKENVIGIIFSVIDIIFSVIDIIFSGTRIIFSVTNIILGLHTSFWRHKYHFRVTIIIFSVTDIFSALPVKLQAEQAILATYLAIYILQYKHDMHQFSHTSYTYCMVKFIKT